MQFSDIIGYLVPYGGGALAVWRIVQNDVNRTRRHKELLASGFCESYSLIGTVILVVDTGKREIAFVYSNAVFRYHFDQIDSWSYEWDLRNGVRLNSRFIVNVLHEDQPRHVTKASASICTHWNAKLNALLNA